MMPTNCSVAGHGARGHASRRAGRHAAAIATLATLLTAACGSDKDSAADDSDAAADASNGAAGTSAGAASSGASTAGELAWIEYASAPFSPASPPSHDFSVAAPARDTDPDAAIERFEKECSGATASDTCRALRREVEGAFLEAILAVRASDEPVDPEWYRVAATADTPQLACLGINELGYLPGRAAEDDAIILGGLDHPAPSVRAAAFAHRQKVPVIEDLGKRWARTGDSGSGTCLDGTADYVPGAKWAGDYPGARYRAFASNNTRRWFTTDDPVDEVLAWFAKSGKAARTKEQLSADAAARFTEEMTKLSSSSDPRDQERLMQLVTGGGGMNLPQTDWDTSSNMEGAGDISYVVLTNDRAVAVFRDDFLKATSIVAPRPRTRAKFPPDIGKATREARARSILGY